MKAQILMEKMLNHTPVLGPFCKITDPAIFEIAGLAGFDFAIIDMEHGPVSYETAQNLVRTCELTGISPIIRVPKNEDHYILRALDIGAHGVEVPEINSKEQAEKLALASRYYPKGMRGQCRFVRAAEYSRMAKKDYYQFANQNTIVIAHLEGVEGLNNLDEILEVEGIDVIFIGPYDLSQSLGIPGETKNPQLIEKMKLIVRKALDKKKVVGTFVETVADAKYWSDLGVAYISYSVDVGLILDKFTEITSSFKQAK
jgi:4-hydroxy-2-oxoheptanedioate aldolase